MANGALALSYALEMFMAAPAATIALAPVHAWVQEPKRRTYPLAAANVLLPKSGAPSLIVALALMLAFGRTLLAKLPALLTNPSIDELWTR